ncbi:gfo/Idh/MocA family oxidoreductase [Pseudochryseolinea flava]|uniref:Gfo/Idh/MocA family oxidoreductase n=2 Tax=Pseudochryseolinea flava TaxID=2059302 RepID=A0A364Y0X8_9BACT|nr:gfo/Idh/MocA family oxidoreductase [Pseudochryseolinea flava]
MGMIGGSTEAFIGAVHRKAAALDGEIELVCGAFSSDPKKSKATGQALYIDPKRVYASYAEMIEQEKLLPENERMQFVSIVTPNHVHLAPAQMALENGFHVIIDKPLAFSLAEAKTLRKVVEKSGLVLALTHTYTGYPMVKEARQLVKQGKIGKVRKVYVEYHQGWLTNFIEGNNKQASWRTDPKRSGLGGAIGDIGTHAANLAEYISGLEIAEISADLNIVVKGRQLDDDSAMLLRFNNGATGILSATQIAAGEENNHNIRIYGDKGAIVWRQEEPNTLLVRVYGKPNEVYRTGWDYLSDAAKLNTRTPWGHPEGYLEAFANLYLAFGRAVRAWKPGKKIDPVKFDFPDVNDGVRGMAFVETVIKSANSNRKWTKFKGE